MTIKSVALALVLALLCVPAMAQQTTGTTGTAQASNNLNVMAVSGGGGVPLDANGNPLPITSKVESSGHVWSTPNVQGGYFAGANPCLVGVGGGAAGGPIGFNFTLGRNDEGCNRRSDAAAWHALGFDRAALARMCQDQDNADAFWAATGNICPGVDPKRYVEKSRAMQAEQPKTVMIPAPVSVVTPAAVAAPPQLEAIDPRCRDVNPAKAEDRPYYTLYKCHATT